MSPSTFGQKRTASGRHAVKGQVDARLPTIPEEYVRHISLVIVVAVLITAIAPGSAAALQQ
jgi:hypothetical protein